MVGSKEIILRYYLEKSRRKSEKIKLGKRKLNCDFFGLGSLILQNVLEIPFCHAVQDPGQKPVANINTAEGLSNCDTFCSLEQVPQKHSFSHISQYSSDVTIFLANDTYLLSLTKEQKD